MFGRGICVSQVVSTRSDTNPVLAVDELLPNRIHYQYQMLRLAAGCVFFRL